MAFPGKNTGVGCHFLLQGIVLSQGSNPCLLHWQVGSLPRSHLGKPNGALGVCFDLWWITILGAVNHATAVFPSVHFRDLQ